MKLFTFSQQLLSELLSCKGTFPWLRRLVSPSQTRRYLPLRFSLPTESKTYSCSSEYGMSAFGVACSWSSAVSFSPLSQSSAIHPLDPSTKNLALLYKWMVWLSSFGNIACQRLVLPRLASHLLWMTSFDRTSFGASLPLKIWSCLLLLCKWTFCLWTTLYGQLQRNVSWNRWHVLASCHSTSICR